ncbi:MAG: response regulator [Cyclobacteriaceae bacterium]|nr:response regulator [Cyclobacteriaceae bacterium]
MSGNDAKILLIDDDPDVLLAARLILKKHFSDITALTSPDDLQALLKKVQFDVALLDMNYSAGATSGKEGFQVLATIKQISPATRVIMMTAYGDIDLAIKAMKEGALDFIVKPWDNAKLINAMYTAISQAPAPAQHNTSAEEKPPALTQFSHAEVTRIFMFLDIKSSTSIAERLGHVKYFQLLNDFFADIAKPVEQNKGQIYQYVGDEVVVSWSFEEGTDNANCLNCFFDIQKTMHSLSSGYFSKYQVSPSFKAGMHYGRVSTGVVGTLKKEIIYTGDVLNTASRIEGLCNSHSVDLLLSETLIKELPLRPRYIEKEIGKIGLRGKSIDITLYTVVETE